MRVETKKVYYCDHCKKHSLRPLTKHERGCTNNPDRECGWMQEKEPHTKTGDLRSLIEWAKSWPETTEHEVEILRGKVEGCPACMLSVLRQGRAQAVRKSRNFQGEEFEYVGSDYHGLFSYTQEIKKFNEDLNEKQNREALYW